MSQSCNACKLFLVLRKDIVSCHDPPSWMRRARGREMAPAPLTGACRCGHTDSGCAGPPLARRRARACVRHGVQTARAAPASAQRARGSRETACLGALGACLLLLVSQVQAVLCVVGGRACGRVRVSEHALRDLEVVVVCGHRRHRRQAPRWAGPRAREQRRGGSGAAGQWGMRRAVVAAHVRGGDARGRQRADRRHHGGARRQHHGRPTVCAQRGQAPP